MGRQERTDWFSYGQKARLLGLKFPKADTTVAAEASRSLARDAASMLFLIIDGKVVYANRKGQEVLGIGVERNSPRSRDVFRTVAVAPEYLELGQESFRRLSRGEEVPPVDYALLTRDGRRIEGVLTSEFIENQGRRRLLGIFTDSNAPVRTD